jgi:hypothetical protein
MKRMRVLPLLLTVILFCMMLSVTSQFGDPILGLILPFGISVIVYLLLNAWHPFRKHATSGPKAIPNGLDDTQPVRTRRGATTGPNASSNDLQGVVRGFKESRQIEPGSKFYNTPDREIVVWSFQLERYSETEDRLPPIPVEMRGKNFSGAINEGNFVKLYERSWNSGAVRTTRVYNVTSNEDVIAYEG